MRSINGNRNQSKKHPECIVQVLLQNANCKSSMFVVRERAGGGKTTKKAFKAVQFGDIYELQKCKRF